MADPFPNAWRVSSLVVGFVFFLTLSTINAQFPSALAMKMDRIIVPKVDFKEVTLDEALDFMAQIPVKTGQLQSPVNMVKAYKTTNPAIGEKPITISLSDVPWTELLRYVCIAANVQFKYEPFAVIISEPVTVPKPTPASTP